MIHAMIVNNCLLSSRSLITHSDASAVRQPLDIGQMVMLACVLVLRCRLFRQSLS
jgi:hypothetical protein